MDINVIMGPREGRHASDDNHLPLLVFWVHTMKSSWMVSYVLTTDDGRIDLDIRQQKRRLARIDINRNRIDEEKP